MTPFWAIATILLCFIPVLLIPTFWFAIPERIKERKSKTEKLIEIANQKLDEVLDILEEIEDNNIELHKKTNKVKIIQEGDEIDNEIQEQVERQWRERMKWSK
jgi:predicted PurR-regulated permease PerM